MGVGWYACDDKFISGTIESRIGRQHVLCITSNSYHPICLFAGMSPGSLEEKVLRRKIS